MNRQIFLGIKNTTPQGTLLEILSNTQKKLHDYTGQYISLIYETTIF